MIRASQWKGLCPQLQLSGSLGCLVPSGAGSQPAKGCGPLLPSWVCGPSEALHGAGCGAQVAPRTCLCLSGDQSPFWSHVQGEDKDSVGQAPAPTRPVKTCAVFLPRTPRALGEPSVTAHMVRPQSTEPRGAVAKERSCCHERPPHPGPSDPSPSGRAGEVRPQRQLCYFTTGQKRGGSI